MLSTNLDKNWSITQRDKYLCWSRSRKPHYVMLYKSAHGLLSVHLPLPLNSWELLWNIASELKFVFFSSGLFFGSSSSHILTNPTSLFLNHQTFMLSSFLSNSIWLPHIFFESFTPARLKKEDPYQWWISSYWTPNNVNRFLHKFMKFMVMDSIREER